MGKIKKVISLVLIVALLAISMVACTNDEISFIDAVVKSSEMTSYESDTKLHLTFKGEGLSEQSKEQIKQVEAYLNDLTFDFNQKAKMSEDKKSMQLAAKFNVNMQGVGMDGGMWIDMDLSSQTPKFKEIFQLPTSLTQSFLPNMADKKYIVLDLASEELQKAGLGLNMGMTLEKSNEIQTLLFDFIKSNAKSFDPGMTVLTNKGAAKNAKGEDVTVYELKLNDASTKTLTQSFINNVVLQESSADFIQKYIEAAMGIYNMSDVGVDLTEQTKTAVDQFKQQIPAFKEQVTLFFDSIKDIKMIGDKGINEEYYVNKDGYLVGQKGSMDIVLNMADLEKLISGQKGTETGTITIGLDYESTFYNINKNNPVEIPELTEANSFDFYKEMTSSMPGNQPVPNPNSINVFLNGDLIVFPDTQPANISGRVLVPIRTVSEELGANVSYDDKTKQVTIVKGDKTIQLTLGKSEAVVNGKTISLDAAPANIEGRVLVPLRFISENMDAVVEWDGTTKSVFITVE